MKKQIPPRRGWPVVFSLVGVLTLTTLLLRVMQGAPLLPDAAGDVVAADSQQALLSIFNTQTPVQPKRWKSIFIHHTRTVQGDGSAANAAGDHFILGNGHGMVEGEIRLMPLWHQQQPGNPMPGVARIDPGCISIALVGDFDQAAPSIIQLRQLQRLVQTLQERLRIPASQVWLVNYQGSSAGIGRCFPISAFQSQILR